jgi:hypothetical protein
VLELMEMQRNAMLMYTSCGWFFSDLSGIETVQVLQYAGRVVQLAERIRPHARADVSHAPRIRAATSRSTARRQIYEREVIPARLDLRASRALRGAVALRQFDVDERVYCYDVRAAIFEIHKAGRARWPSARSTMRSLITRETASFEFAVIHLGETELTGGVRPCPTR